MIIESPAFQQQQMIPSKYTCEGENISPALKFLQVPPDTKSLVLIVDDPDAPKGTFDHWIVWNLPPNLAGLDEGAEIPYPKGTNHYNELRYRGPCPPPGKPHRYFFKLYALSILIDLPEGSLKQDVENAMKKHILENAELIGIYQR